jgi:CheY-like chemotaxis protein
MIREPLNISPDSDLAQTRKLLADVKTELAGMRILLAEDGIDNQRLISHILRSRGAEVIVVENGLQACDAVNKATSEQRPFHVILMDMQMPEMDGYAATSQLRSANYPGVIIALTAHAMDSDRDKCLQAGCTDYATKPIDRKHLVALLTEYFKKAGSAKAA